MNFFQKFMVRKFLVSISKEDYMKGWKTWVGGLGSILTGGAIVSGGLLNNFDLDTITKGIVAILAGFSVLGIGHKIEKAGNGK